MEWLARALGIEGASASQVSEMKEGLDERVKEFRTRPLSEEYPFIWIEAVYEKVRSDGRVVGLFFSFDSYLGLVVSYLMESTEDRANDYAYIKANKLTPNGVAQVANYESKNGEIVMAKLRTKFDMAHG